MKSGNLRMVHNLIKYYKVDQNVVLLKGWSDEFAISKTEKISMEEWNPLLVAIAYKKLEIVRYLLNQLNISLRISGMKPGEMLHLTPEVLAEK